MFGIKKDKCFESVPDTIEEAVISLCEYIKTINPSIIKGHWLYDFEFQRKIRNSWKLWSQDSVIANDAKKRYGIEHADDVSGLIAEWAFAKADGIDFSTEKYCEECQNHWKMFQKDAGLNLI